MLQSIKKLTQKNRSSQKLSQPNLSKSCLRILKWKHQFKMLTNKTRNHLQKSVMMERTAKAWAPEKEQLKWVCKKWKNKLVPKNQTFQNRSWNKKSNQRLRRRKSRKEANPRTRKQARQAKSQATKQPKRLEQRRERLSNEKIHLLNLVRLKDDWFNSYFLWS